MVDLTVSVDPAAILSDAGPRPHEATELDLRGLRCPLPVLHTRKALGALASGALLRVICTDPLAGLDIPHLLAETGDTLMSADQASPAQVFLIRRA